MAGIELGVELRDDVSAVLGQLVAAGADLTPAMKDISGHLADTTRERFETQRDPLGVPWKPSRRVVEEGGETLTLSGDLRSSLREDWGADYAAAGPEASGGAAVYAAIHQLGGRITPKRGKALRFGSAIVAAVVIPARAYLGFNDENADYALETLTDHLRRAAGGAGEVTP